MSGDTVPLEQNRDSLGTAYRGSCSTWTGSPDYVRLFVELCSTGSSSTPSATGSTASARRYFPRPSRTRDTALRAATDAGLSCIGYAARTSPTTLSEADRVVSTPGALRAAVRESVGLGTVGLGTVGLGT